MKDTRKPLKDYSPPYPFATVRCPNCAGRGRSRKTEVVCLKCKGTGQVRLSEIVHTEVTD